MAELKAAYTQQINGLNKLYVTNLQKLSKAYTARKNLDGALAVNREIQTIQRGERIGALPQTSPPELLQARKAYGEKRKAISNAIQQKKMALDASKPTPDPKPDPDPMPAPEAAPVPAPAAKPEENAGGQPAAYVLKPNRKTGPDAALLRKELWDKDVTLRTGTYRLKDTISVTNQPGPTVTLETGTVVKDGTLFLAQGKLVADGCLFEEVTLAADLGGEFDFKNCYFDECRQAKAGRYISMALYSARWNFNNCVFDDTFAQNWNTVGYGVTASYCTFNKIEFPDLKFYNKTAPETRSEKLKFRHCRFIRCEIPLSVLLITEQCVFENCKILKDPPNKPLDEKIILSANLIHHRGKISTLHDQLDFVMVESDIPTAGAQLKR